MTKPRTIPTKLEDVAPLALWLAAYPCIRQNPGAWLKGYHPTPADLRRYPELFNGDELYPDETGMKASQMHRKA